MTGHVIIAGAGIGGLCLAQGLRKRGVRVSVYEIDDGLDAQWSGYRLHLTGEANRALHRCLPLENYLGVLRGASTPLDAFHIIDHTLDELSSFPFTADPALLIDDDVMIGRYTLRSMLLSGIEDTVHWGRGVDGYRVLPDNQVSVRLTDGTSVQATMLVGADGRSSRVREQLLPDAEPAAWDYRCVAGTTPVELATTLDLPPPFLQGTGFVLGPQGHNMFFSYHDPTGPGRPVLPGGGLDPPGQDSYVLWAVGGPVAEWETDPRESGPGESLLPLALGMIEDWRPAVRELVSGASPSSLYPLTFWVAPETEPWETVPCVTVLGDAVHVMPPTGGIGASTALCDAAALADALELVEQGLAEPAHALRVYEAEMLERGQDAISTSVSNLRWAQRLDGPVAFRLGKFGLKTVTETQNALRSLAERIGLRDGS